ncbi:GtrA family protein [Aneurinibacillus sp. Ricciae_BoGa-3]|uniref:GtrA family protein n=1 Tax=Aneurinibacillus sp. Ricciae_BoGa-3 TaxID=3022697 RepID=UPI00233FF460|nr:GtrA family protein [Aneurinibacillus sp. Ricciae_BoGa-3]WCK55636.1 GtrA family protein [Aneurinibacillus sp. Ricciae_BoGa-3]
MLNNKRDAVQILRFSIVGTANATIDFTVFFFLTVIGLPYLLSQIGSYSAGVLNSFFLNRKWTFKVGYSANPSEIMKFMIINAASLSLSFGLLYLLHDRLMLGLLLSKIGATGCGTVVNFMGSRLWVFTENKTIGGRPRES